MIKTPWSASVSILLASATLAACPLAARDITSLVVDSEMNAASVRFEAGQPGDMHAIYYAWANDGVDRGGGYKLMAERVSRRACRR